MKERHSTQTKNHDHCEVVAIHMFLNVSDELRLVPSLLYEVVGVVSRHATFLERSLVQRSHGRNLVQFCFQFHVGTTLRAWVTATAGFERGNRVATFRYERATST